jgi:hypothetical protein
MSSTYDLSGVNLKCANLNATSITNTGALTGTTLNTTDTVTLQKTNAVQSVLVKTTGSGNSCYFNISNDTVPQKNALIGIDGTGFNGTYAGKFLLQSNNDIVLNIEGRSISYKSDSLRFDVRTLENEMVPLPKFNPKKMEEYPNILGEFQLNQKIVQELKKADVFTSDSMKFYLEKDDDKLYVTFGDKLQSNLNSATVLLRDNFTNEIPTLIYNAEALRSMFKMKNSNISVRILDSGALLFITKTDISKSIFYATKLKQ